MMNGVQHMAEMNENRKDLLGAITVRMVLVLAPFLLTVIFFALGFYFTTTLRLDKIEKDLEDKVDKEVFKELQEKIEKMDNRVYELHKTIVKPKE